MAVIYQKRYSNYFRTEAMARRSFALFYLHMGEHPDIIPPFPLEQAQTVYPNKVYTDPNHSPLWCPSEPHKHPRDTIDGVAWAHLIDPLYRLHFEMKYEREHGTI